MRRAGPRARGGGPAPRSVNVLLLGLSSVPLVGAVTADGAARGGPHHTVAHGVTGEPADEGALDATLGFGCATQGYGSDDEAGGGEMSDHGTTSC